MKILNFKFQISKKGFLRLTKRALATYLIGFLIFSASGLLFLFNPWTVKQAQAAWFDDNWAYRNNFPLTSVTGANNVYLTVTIDTATLITANKMNLNCSDLRFTDQGGNLLSYFIVSGCNSASTSVHVQYTSLQGANQPLYFYYGNDGATSKSVAADFSTAGTATVGSVGTEEKTPAPAAYFKFDEGTGGQLKNSGSVSSARILLMQTKAAESLSGAGAQAATFDNQPIQGDLVVVACVANTASSTFTVTDNATNTYTQAVRVQSAGAQLVEAVFYAYNIATTSSFQVTCTSSSGTDFVSTAIHEYSGVLRSSDPKDGSTSSNAAVGGGNTTANLTITPAVSNELAFGAMSNGGSANEVMTSTGTGYTQRVTVNTNSDRMPIATADNAAVSASTTENWTINVGGAAPWTVTTLVTFKPDTMVGAAFATTWQTEDMCIAGKCLLLNGTSSKIFAGDNGILNFAAADNFTVGAWVKHSGTVSAQEIILSKATSAATYTGYKLYFDASANLCFESRDGTNGADSACSSGIRYDDNQWHFIEGVKEGTSAVRIYVDGILKNSKTSLVSTGTLSNSSCLLIGTNLSAGTCDSSPTYANFFKGFIDEVKIYRDQSIRTAAQVKADYNSRNVVVEGNNFSTSNLNNPNALNNGLVGYWKLDESSGNAADTSGNGITLTNTNSATYTTGQFGNAGSFTRASSQYEFAASATGSVLDATGNVTVAAWIRPASITASTQFDIAGKWDGSNNSYLLQQFASDIRFYIGSSSNYVSTSSLGLSTNTWYHIVGTYQASSGTANIYVNGTVQTTTVTGTIPTSITSNAGRFHIAADSSTTTAANFYDGRLDEVRVYTRTLSGNDVSILYNFAPGPVGYWKMDEGSGSSVNDSSGNANTGTWAGTGSPHWTSGKYGKATNYNGTDDEVDVSNSTNLNTSNNWTVSGWFMDTNSTLNHASVNTLLCKGNTTNANFLYCAEVDNNQIRVGYSNGNTWGTGVTRLTYAIGTNGYSASTWIHLAFSYSTSSNTITLYLNGTQVAQQTSAVANPGATDTLYLGREGNGAFWQGRLDDMKIYNYVRTSRQVIEDMNAGHPPPGSPVGTPVGWWKLDEGYGTGTGNARNSGNCGSTCNGNLTSFAAIAEVQAGTEDFASSNSFTVSITSVTANNFLVVSIPLGSSSVTISSISDDNGTITQAANNAGAGLNDYIYYVQNAAAGTHNVSVTLSGTTGHQSLIVEYSGIITSGNPVDQTQCNSGTSTSPSSGSITTTSANELLVGSHRYINNESITPGAGFLSRSTNSRALHEDQIVTSTGTYSAGASIGASDAWDACIASFKGSQTVWTNSAKFGKAISFDGIGYIAMPSDVTQLKITGGLTLSAWINLTNTSVRHDIICKWTGTASTSSYCMYTDSSGKLNFAYSSGGTPANTTVTGVQTLSASTWYHVTAIFNPSDKVYLYINGVLDTSSSTSATSLTNSTTIMDIAGENAGSNLFVGIIDEPKVYNAALTADQVKLDANRSSAQVLGALSGPTSDSGTSSGSNTSTTLNDTSKSWATNQWTNYFVTIGPGTGLGQTRLISSNTATALTISPAWSTTPDSTSGYIIWQSGQNAASEYCIPGDTSRCLAPVGRWDFEDGSGSTTNDTSGNGNTGTLSGTTGTPAFAVGKVGKSLSFTQANRQYVNTGNLSTLNDLVSQGNGGMTVEAWIKPTIANQYYQIVDKSNLATPTSGWAFEVDGTADTIPTSIDFSHSTSGTTIKRQSASNSITSGVWTHVVATWTGTVTDATTIRLYMNGKEVSSYGLTTNGSGTKDDDAGQGLGIGCNIAHDVNACMQGNIDQVRVFNYVRTPAQVAWDYNRGGPQGWWKFDECQGTTTNDAAGNSNTGTITIGGSGTQTAAGTCIDGLSTSAWNNGKTGKRNYSLNFDGTDDYDDVGRLTFTESASAASWAFWVKPGTLATGRCLFCKRNNAATSQTWGIMTGGSDSSVIRAQVATGTTDQSTYCESPTGVLTNGTWTNVVVVYDGSGSSTSCGRIKIYVNGVLQTSTQTGTPPTTTSNATANARFAASSDGAQFFSGQIDDARAYHYVLTSNQVLQIYNNSAINFGPTTGAP